MYFQLRGLPCAIHSTACLTRLAFVSLRLASAIHRAYSRLQLALKSEKTFVASLFFFRAAANSCGTRTGFFADFFGRARDFVRCPDSTRPAAWLMYASSTRSVGKASSPVMRPRVPIASLDLRPSLARTLLISGPQKPKAQCCLKDAMLEMMIPCWTKNGMLHLMVSAMCGQAWCMSLRK